MQEFQPVITTHPSLFPQEEGRSLEEGQSGVVRGHIEIGVEGISQTPKFNLADDGYGKYPTTQEPLQETQGQDHINIEAGPSTPLSPTSPLEFKMSTSGYVRRARRSSCPPSCTSPLDSTYSSQTLFDTPRHSEDSSSPTSIEFRRTTDKHANCDNDCWLVLAEHLKTEEQDTEDTKWEIVMEWMKLAHKTEVAELQSQIFVAETILQARDVDLANEREDHDADLKAIEKLKEERSKARKRLSEYSSELRSTKKELSNLKKSIEKTQEQCSDERVLAEHGDVEEGGVRLVGSSSSPKAEACELQENPEAGVQSLGETSGEVRVNDDSKGFSARVRDLEMQNETLTENLEYATEEVARLRSEANSTKDEVKKLKAENRFAQIEVGHCHAINAQYRNEMENADPARTAYIDGHLKRKDEAYTELEISAADCAEQLAEEQKNRAVDNVYAQGKITGLNKELAHQSHMIAALTKGRDMLQEQKEEIFQMFNKKILLSDADQAFRNDYDVIKKDNALLIKMINEHHRYLEDADKPVADLKAENLILEHAARSDQLKQRQLQQSINGLEAKNGELQNRVQVQTEMREEAEEQSNARAQQQAEEIQRLLNHGAEDGWRRLLQAQAQELVNCRGEVTRLTGLAEQWRMRAIEVQDDFSPMLHFAEVRDWGAEQSRWRLHHAERRAAESEKRERELERKFRDAVRDGKRREEREDEHEG